MEQLDIMVSLRILCEKYISIDDEVKKINEKVEDNISSPDKTKYLAEYLEKYMEREDFKSGMRRYLINELVTGIKGE